MLRMEQRLCNKLESNGLKPEMRGAFFSPSLCPMKYSYSGEGEREKVEIYDTLYIVLKNISHNMTAVRHSAKFSHYD